MPGLMIASAPTASASLSPACSGACLVLRNRHAAAPIGLATMAKRAAPGSVPLLPADLQRGHAQIRQRQRRP